MICSYPCRSSAYSLVDFREWNRQVRRGCGAWRSSELHRRQVLEHEVPLPALRRVRGLQPVLRRDRPRELEVRELRVGSGCRTSPTPARRGSRRCSRTRTDAPSARPTFTNTCQSSWASPGGSITRADAWSRPCPLTYVASFSTHAAPGSTMSAAFARSVISTPCTISVLMAPALRAAITHDKSPIEPAGPGSKT